MKSILLITTLLFASLPGLAQESKPAQPPRSSLAGTVVNAQGGEPIRKAIVQAIAEAKTPGEAVMYSAVTDAAGHFKMESLEPGRYRVFVEKTGFIGLDEHHHRSDGVELTLAGKPLDDVVLRVTPAAAIAGRVLDEDGDPMPDVSVSVLHWGYSGCRAQLESQASERTNDLGEYRVGGLPPGKYLVSASPLPGYTAVSNRKQRDPSKPELSYVTTYYPSVADANQAASLELHPGETIPVDFSLARVQSFRVRGAVTHLASALRPASVMDGVVTLQSKGPEGIVRQGEIDRTGNFEVQEVPPGSYTAVAVTPDGGLISASQPVEVTTSDLNNVQLLPEAHGRLRGQLGFEGARVNDSSGFRVLLRRLDLAIYIGGIDSDRGQVKRDGTFDIADVPPGTYELQLASSSSSGFFIKQVRSGGRDVTDIPLHVSGGTMDIELIASSASAQISGSVIDGHDQPAPNVTVVAIPSPTRRGIQDHYGTAVTDQFGRFQIRGVRPDDYSVLAWDDVDSGAWCDPNFLKMYENTAQKIHVDEGDRQSVTVKLAASGDPPK